MPTKLPRISFTAAPGLRVGDLVRHMARGYKFWNVISIKNGVAIARADASEEPALSSGAC